MRCCHRLSSTALRVGAGSRCTRRIHDRGSMGAFADDGPAHGPAAGARLGSGISVGPPRSPRTPTQPAPHRCRPTTGSDPRDDLWYMCSTCAVHVQYEGERYAPNYSYLLSYNIYTLTQSYSEVVCCRSHLLKIALLLPARSVRVRIRGSRAHAGDGARTRHALPSPLAASLRTLPRRTLCASPIGVTRRSHLARSSPSAWPAAPHLSPPRDGNRY